MTQHSSEPSTPFDSRSRLWIGFLGTELDGALSDHLQAVRPGGIVLFRRNLRSAEQVRRLIGGLRELLGDALFVSVDQEGGRVDRFGEIVSPFPGNHALGAIALEDLDRGCELARRQGQQLGSELRAFGVDVNLAPCVDLATEPANTIVDLRSFGADPECVRALACAMVEGQRAGGVFSTAKHYPGLGDAAVDPHDSMARIASARGRAKHAGAFDIGAEFAMTTHVVVDSIDPSLPATYSPAVVSQLRSQLGTEPVLVTDDLEMGGLDDTRDRVDRVRRALDAGHDVALVCHDRNAQRAVADALLAADAEGAAWLGNRERVAARISKLRARPSIGAGEEDGAALARTIADEAVHVLRGSLDLSGERTLVIVPQPAIRTGAEDLPDDPLAPLVAALSGAFDVERLSAKPTGSDFARLAPRVVDYRHVVVVLAGVRFSSAQRELARQVAEWHSGVLFALLSGRFDADVLPGGEGVTVVCAHGSARSSQEALARRLRSASERA